MGSEDDGESAAVTGGSQRGEEWHAVQGMESTCRVRSSDSFVDGYMPVCVEFSRSCRYRFWKKKSERDGWDPPRGIPQYC